MLEPKHELIWVESDLELNRLCLQWQSCSKLAMDTEFIRTDSYYPIPALIQVFDGKANYLIDPTRIGDWSKFTEILTAADISKIFHACSEDLEVFDHLLGCVPDPIFDTQIAAAFCGYGFSVGYANLVKAMMDIDVPKDETRSDWLQRPLSDAQKAYAALDVEFLYSMAQTLEDRLDQNGRREWVMSECSLLSSALRLQQDPDSAITRFKAAWRLDDVSYGVLVNLASWRELEAQRSNLPRNHVIKEKSLYEIAEQKPHSVAQLRKIQGLSGRCIRKYGEAVVDCIDDSLRNGAADHAESMVKPLSAKQNKKVKALRAAVNSVAESLDVAPEVLARKKDFEYIVRASESGASGLSAFPEHFADWRESILIQPMMNALDQFAINNDSHSS